jgi:hypothetical protein
LDQEKSGNPAPEEVEAEKEIFWWKRRNKSADDDRAASNRIMSDSAASRPQTSTVQILTIASTCMKLFFLFIFFFIFVTNQVQISCLISWSSELNGCGFLLLCQEQNITSKNRSDVGCTGTPFRISQFNALRVLCYWVMKSFMIHLWFYSCGAPSTGWWLSAEFSRLTIKVFQSPEFFEIFTMLVL